MYNILVCDDEKDIVSALRIYLMAEGYQVLEAYNGKEVLEVLEKNDIHLVLMDIMMSQMDGIEAMVKLLLENQGKVFSPHQIYETVWKDNLYGAENTVAVHIRHLREKIEYNPAEPRYLKAVWGRGYKVEE